MRMSRKKSAPLLNSHMLSACISTSFVSIVSCFQLKVVYLSSKNDIWRAFVYVRVCVVYINSWSFDFSRAHHNKWINGWMDEWLAGWMNGWMDGSVYMAKLRQTENKSSSENMLGVCSFIFCKTIFFFRESHSNRSSIYTDENWLLKIKLVYRGSSESSIYCRMSRLFC